MKNGCMYLKNAVLSVYGRSKGIVNMDAEIIKRLSAITDEERQYLEGQKDIDKNIYTQKKELVIEGAKLLERGKLIQVRPHSRFVHFPKHRHDYVEVIYMCQGSTTHLINGNEVLLKEGELLFLNQGATQEILPAGEKDIAVNFIILPQFFNTAFVMMGGEENLLRNFLLDCLSEKNKGAAYLHFHVAGILPVQNLLENMVWTILHDQPNKRSNNQITMGLLLLLLLNYMDKMESADKQYQKDFIVSVLSYIEGHYKDGSLAELAQMLGQELYFMSREIKKQTGHTYKELLQTKRLNQAAYLLKNSRMPVNDVIEAVGYDNTSYFFKIFKEKYRMSPKEYRNCK